MPFVKDDPRINREGRPEGSKNFTTKVREALEKIAEGKDYTYEEAFIKSILKKAIVDGDGGTQRLIWNYLDGLPLQRLGNADGSNLTPIPIIQLETNVLSANNSDKQDIEDDQENQDSSGRNECEQNNINNTLSNSNGSTGWKQNTDKRS